MRRGGFSLIETMISLAIVGVALSGALLALVAAGQSAREGQYRQFKNSLAEAAAARYRLMDKTLLAGLVTGAPPPLISPIGGWPVDTTPLQVLPAGIDLSTGAYFTIDTAGQVGALAGVAPGTPCNSASIGLAAKASCAANGTCAAFCREVLVLTGLPGSQCAFARKTLDGQGRSIDCTWWGGTGGATAVGLPGAATAVTVYVRVSRWDFRTNSPEVLGNTVQRSEVFIQ